MTDHLKTIRSALDQIAGNDWDNEYWARKTAQETLASLAALEQAMREPVAWMLTNGELTANTIEVAAHEHRGNEATPLFAAPPAQQAQPTDTRTCTCHPDDNPPTPCAKKYSLSECKQAQAEAVPFVQIVNCDTCKHSGKACDDYPCRNCGVEFGNGPFNRWEAPQQAEAVPQSIAEQFEAMHARGDVWITTLAAAALAAAPKGQQP